MATSTPSSATTSAALLFFLLLLLQQLCQQTALVASETSLPEEVVMVDMAAGPPLLLAEEEALVVAAPLSEEVMSEVAMALRGAALLPLNPLEGGAGTFFIASLLLPHIRLLTRQRSALLLPSDSAIAATSPLHLLAAAAISPAHLRSLALLHMLPSNLSFSHIRLLPDGALLPTLLGETTRLRVSAADGPTVLLAGARIIRPDICPASIAYIVTCHGIDRILTAADADTSAASALNSPPPLPSSPLGPASTANYGAVPAASPDVTDAARNSTEKLPSATVADTGNEGRRSAPTPAPATSSATMSVITIIMGIETSILVALFPLVWAL